MTDFQPELDRIRDAYRERDAKPGVAGDYDPLRPAAMFRVQQRDQAYADLLRRSGLRSLGGRDLLDVGCGSGAGLLRLIALGAEPDRMSGIDLMPDRLADARRLLPQADLRLGSAHELPFPDRRFDLVVQETLFSSVVDPGLQEAIALEMRRVLRAGGRILWYDAARGPTTQDLAPITTSRLAHLFPGARTYRRAATLRWWLNERVVPRSRPIAALLARVPIFCSHDVAVIMPPDETAGR